MLLYRIDRRNEIMQPGEFLPDSGLTNFGDVHWKEKPLHDLSSVMDCITEHLFESVRLQEFPHMPSRFSCAFACDNQDLEPWIRFFERQGNQVNRIWLLDAPVAYRVDSSLLRSFWMYSDGLWFDPSFTRACARAYWGQSNICELIDGRHPQPIDRPTVPFYEWLVPAPVRAVRLLHPQEVAALRG